MYFEFSTEKIVFRIIIIGIIILICSAAAILPPILILNLRQSSTNCELSINQKTFFFHPLYSKHLLLIKQFLSVHQQHVLAVKHHIVHQLLQLSIHLMIVLMIFLGIITEYLWVHLHHLMV